MKCSLVSQFFLKRCLVFPIPLFSSISLHWSLRKAFLSLPAYPSSLTTPRPHSGPSLHTLSRNSNGLQWTTLAHSWTCTHTLFPNQPEPAPNMHTHTHEHTQPLPSHLLRRPIPPHLWSLGEPSSAGWDPHPAPPQHSKPFGCHLSPTVTSQQIWSTSPRTTCLVTNQEHQGYRTNKHKRPSQSFAVGLHI